jgi:hypothetical protein
MSLNIWVSNKTILQEYSLKCWAERYLGFNKIHMSWSSRQLDTLVQRVEVIRIFATSKLWYKQGLCSSFALEIYIFRFL